jgi:hypothetical protein
MRKPLAAALFCFACVAGGTAAAQQLGTIRFDSWLSYQRNTDNSGRWQYDPRVFIPFTLSSGWTFTQRFDLPVLYTDSVGPDNLSGGWKAGIGDWYAEEKMETPPLAENFSMWGSLRFVFPTGGASPFGSGQYQLAPAVGATYAMPERGITLAPTARYFMSYHATQSGAPKIRQLLLYPTVVFALPESWSLSVYPENGIAYNDVTHKWFVPIDLLVLKRLTNGMDLGIGGAYPLQKDNRSYNYNIYGRMTFYF